MISGVDFDRPLITGAGGWRVDETCVTVEITADLAVDTEFLLQSTFVHNLDPSLREK